MDIIKQPLVLVEGIRRHPMGRRWLQPLSVQLHEGVPVLWVVLEADDVAVDLCVRIFPTGAGLELTSRDLDSYVGTWIRNGYVWHTFAWGEVHGHEPEHLHEPKSESQS